MRNFRHIPIHLFRLRRYLENKTAIEKLKTEVELKSWADEINTKDFEDSYKQIMKEYAGDSSGKGSI